MLPAWLMHVVARLGTGCSTLAKCFATSSLLLPLGKMLRPSDSVSGGSEMPGTLGQPKAVAISSHPFADLKAVSSMSQLVAVIHQQQPPAAGSAGPPALANAARFSKTVLLPQRFKPKPFEKRISKHMHLQKLQHEGCPDCGYAHTTKGPLVGNKTHGRAPWFSNSFSMSSRERFLAACAQQPPHSESALLHNQATCKNCMPECKNCRP